MLADLSTLNPEAASSLNIDLGRMKLERGEEAEDLIRWVIGENAFRQRDVSFHTGSGILVNAKLHFQHGIRRPEICVEPMADLILEVMLALNNIQSVSSNWWWRTP